MEFLKRKHSEGNMKNIAGKVLEALIDYNTDEISYDLAIQDFNELGGIDGISEIMEWNTIQKQNWYNKIINVYNIK